MSKVFFGAVLAVIFASSMASAGDKTIYFGLPEWRVSEYDLRCQIYEDAPIYSAASKVGISPDAFPEGVTRMIIEPVASRDARLPDLRVKDFSFRDLPVDYVVMLLARHINKPVYADKMGKMPRINGENLNGSFEEVIDRVASKANVKWSYTGEAFYLYSELEWSVERPAHRDLSVAMLDGLRGKGASYVGVSPDGTRVLFGADRMKAAQLEADVRYLLAQRDIVTFDIATYLVRPKSGTIDVDRLVRDTDVLLAYKELSKGVMLSLDTTRFALIEGFLAGEGPVTIAKKQIVSAPVNWQVGVENKICGSVPGFEDRVVGFMPTGMLDETIAFEFDVKKDGRAHMDSAVRLAAGKMVVVIDKDTVDGWFMVTAVRPRAISLVGNSGR